MKLVLLSKKKKVYIFCNVICWPNWKTPSRIKLGKNIKFNYYNLYYLLFLRYHHMVLRGLKPRCFTFSNSHSLHSTQMSTTLQPQLHYYLTMEENKWMKMRKSNLMGWKWCSKYLFGLRNFTQSLVAKKCENMAEDGTK